MSNKKVVFNQNASQPLVLRSTMNSAPQMSQAQLRAIEAAKKKARAEVDNLNERYSLSAGQDAAEAAAQSYTDQAMANSHELRTNAETTQQTRQKTRDKRARKRGYGISNEMMLQEALWNAGYGRTNSRTGKQQTYEQFVDGYEGKDTNYWLQKAKNDGYNEKDLRQGKITLIKKNNQEPSKDEDESWFTKLMRPLSTAERAPMALGYLIANRNAYRGTEEGAQNMGYEHYVPDGFDVTGEFAPKVSYYVEGQENMTPTQRAAAQMEKYGITQEYVRDKTPIGKLLYEYLPDYGYVWKSAVEDFLKGRKRYDASTGTPTDYNPTYEDYDWFQRASEEEKANAQRITAGRAKDNRHRHDARNLYFGYPIRNGTLQVNTNISQEFANSRPDLFKYGYSFVDPTYSEALFNDPHWNDLTEHADYSEAKQQYAETWGVGGDPNDTTSYRNTNGYNMGRVTVRYNPGDKRWYADEWDLLPGINDIYGRGFSIYDSRPER